MSLGPGGALVHVVGCSAAEMAAAAVTVMTGVAAGIALVIRAVRTTRPLVPTPENDEAPPTRRRGGPGLAP